MTKMKFLAAVACLAVTFSACKKKDKNDESANNKAALVGKWNMIETYALINGEKTPGEEYKLGEYERFTATDTLYNGDKTTVPGHELFVFYKVVGSNVYLYNEKSMNDRSEIWHIDAINNTDLTMSIEGEENGVKAKIVVKAKKQ